MTSLRTPEQAIAEREGHIEPGSVPFFPADKFEGYLWGFENAVWLSLIISRQPGKGHLSQLFKDIWATGRDVVVPTPLGHMEAICQAKGFVPLHDPDRDVPIYLGAKQ